MSDKGLSFANPDKFEETVELAHAMYGHISKAGMAGMAFADVCAAVAILNGMLLAGAYIARRDQNTASKTMAAAAVTYAQKFKHHQRIPWEELDRPGFSA